MAMTAIMFFCFQSAALLGVAPRRSRWSAASEPGALHRHCTLAVAQKSAANAAPPLRRHYRHGCRPPLRRAARGGGGGGCTATAVCRPRALTTYPSMYAGYRPLPLLESNFS